MPPIDEMESRIAGAILADIPFLAKWRGVILSVGGGGGDPTSAPDPERLAPNLRTGRDLNLAMNALTTRRGLQPTELAHVMLEPLSPSIGTVIHGVDLANLSNEEVTLIKRVWLQVCKTSFCLQCNLLILPFREKWLHLEAKATSQPLTKSRLHSDLEKLMGQWASTSTSRVPSQVWHNVKQFVSISCVMVQSHRSNSARPCSTRRRTVASPSPQRKRKTSSSSKRVAC